MMKMVHISEEYNELACAYCGENSITKITMRGFVFYLCWNCTCNLTEEMYDGVKM